MVICNVIFRFRFSLNILLVRYVNSIKNFLLCSTRLTLSYYFNNPVTQMKSIPRRWVNPSLGISGDPYHKS